VREGREPSELVDRNGGRVSVEEGDRAPMGEPQELDEHPGRYALEAEL